MTQHTQHHDIFGDVSSFDHLDFYFYLCFYLMQIRIGKGKVAVRSCLDYMLGLPIERALP